MKIMNESYQISFTSHNVSEFSKIFATLLQSFATTETLPNFNISCNKERIIILLPADPQSFFLIGQIIQQLDNWSITHTSSEQQISEDNVAPSKSKVETKTKQMLDYALTLETFTLQDLKKNFRNFSVPTISKALTHAKNEGLITQTNNGKYSVINSKNT